MRKILPIAALAGFVLGFAPSCSTKVNGQLVLVLQTDMSLPKDIDRVRIEATRTETGAVVYQHDFEKLGGAESIKLPGTLPFSAPEDLTDAIRIRVIASRGSDEGVKILREVVTTVPGDRVALLPLTLEFLCNGSGEAERDENGKVKRDPSGNVIVKSSCPEGRTCVAGTCADTKVKVEDLPDYEQEEVFGGGSGDGDGICFDTAKCFEDWTEVGLDLAAFASDPTLCQGTVSSDANIALRTQGGGICGASGCFVALDAESNSGWKLISAGKISLPSSVCAKVQAGEIAGVVSAPVGKETCQLKRSSIPTCGPWSASGADAYTTPDPLDPVLVAPGQENLTSLALAGGTLYWSCRGTADGQGTSNNDGSVKAVGVEGGEPTVLAANQAAPNTVALDLPRQFVLWTSSDDGQVMSAPFVDQGVTPVPVPLVTGLLQPKGLTVHGATVSWTDRWSEQVFQIETTVSSDTLVAVGAPVEIPPPATKVSLPGSIVAAKGAVCWVYEDELTTSGGVVACSLSNQTVTIAEGQSTPRFITLGLDQSKAVTAVYWANFAKKSKTPDVVGGGIFKVDISGAAVGPVKKVAGEEDPGGLALDPDGQRLYWTSFSRGVVMALGPDDQEPVLLVEGLSNPGAITASENAVYWLNEGKNEGGVSDGTIMKVLKSPPQ